MLCWGTGVPTKEDPGAHRPSHQLQYFTRNITPSSGRLLMRWLQVVPNQVEVERCGGSCPRDSQHSYERCSVLERDVTRVEVAFQVLREGGGLEEQCSQVSVETHTACRCGCQQLNCSTDLQVETRQSYRITESLLRSCYLPEVWPGNMRVWVPRPRGPGTVPRPE